MLLLGSDVHRASAQAASVSPQSVLLSERRPSGSLTVLNPNEGPIDVSIGLRFGKVATDSSTGRTVVQFVADSLAPANSAVSLVRFAPARFQLAPGASQVVRFVSVVPAELTPGEYWARVAVSASAASAAASPSDPALRVSGSVNIEVQTVVPLFVRKGRVATGLEGQLAAARRVGDTVHVAPTFTRTGNGAAIGLLRFDVLDARDAVLWSTTRQLAVYDALTPRYELPLVPGMAGRAARVRLSVTATRPDLPEGLPLPFAPLALTTRIDSVPSGDGTRDAPTEVPSETPAGVDGDALGNEALEAGTPHNPTLPLEACQDVDEVPALGKRPSTAEEGDAPAMPLCAAWPSPDSSTVRRAPPRVPPRADSLTRRVERLPSVTATNVARDRTGDDALAILAVMYGDEEIGTVFTQESGVANRPLLPLLRFAELVGAQVEFDGARREARVRMPVLVPLEAYYQFDSGRATRQVAGAREESRVFPGQPVRRVDGDWFVDAEVLEWLTGIGLKIDAATASLLLDARRDRIPRFAAEVARSERRATLGSAPNEVPRGDGERLYRTGIVPRGVSATYAHSTDNQTGDFVSTATVGTTVLGGGLALDLRSTRFGANTRTLADVSWLGGDPTNPLLRQWRLGAGSTTGPLALVGRGVSLSNSPFLRSRQLGTTMRSGTAPPGAEIELTRNGQVIGVTVADSSGRWTLPMPVDFGQNTIEVAVYTAQGVVRQATMLNLEQDLIPARTVEYGVTMQDNDTPDSECRRGVGPCGYVGNADLRVGLATRLTARVGAYELRPHDGGAVQRLPYAAILASPIDWVQLRGEGTQTGWWRARAIVQPNLHLRVEVSDEAIDPRHVPFWLQQQAQFRTRDRAAGVTLRPLRNVGRAWLSTQWRATDGPRGRFAIVNGTAGVRLGRILVQGTYDYAATEDTVVGRLATATRGASLTFPQLPRGPQWVRRSFVSVGTTTDERWRPRFVTSQVSMSFARRFFVQGGVDWMRGTRAPSFRLQIQHQGSLAMLFQDVAANAGGRTASTTTVMGTATLSGRQGVQLSGDFVALRSRVSGLAFEDRNGNGRFDPSEPRLADVSISVGGQIVRTDEQGRYQLSGLPVMDAMAVAAHDEMVLALDGRMLVPAAPRAWAMLVPFGETRLDVAFTEERPANGVTTPTEVPSSAPGVAR